MIFKGDNTVRRSFDRHPVSLGIQRRGKEIDVPLPSQQPRQKCFRNRVIAWDAAISKLPAISAAR